MKEVTPKVRCCKSQRGIPRNGVNHLTHEDKSEANGEDLPRGMAKVLAEPIDFLLVKQLEVELSQKEGSQVLKEVQDEQVEDDKEASPKEKMAKNRGARSPRWACGDPRRTSTWHRYN